MGCCQSSVKLSKSVNFKDKKEGLPMLLAHRIDFTQEGCLENEYRNVVSLIIYKVKLMEQDVHLSCD